MFPDVGKEREDGERRSHCSRNWGGEDDGVGRDKNRENTPDRGRRRERLSARAGGEASDRRQEFVPQPSSNRVIQPNHQPRPIPINQAPFHDTHQSCQTRISPPPTSHRIPHPYNNPSHPQPAPYTPNPLHASPLQHQNPYLYPANPSPITRHPSHQRSGLGPALYPGEIPYADPTATEYTSPHYTHGHYTAYPEPGPIYSVYPPWRDRHCRNRCGGRDERYRGREECLDRDGRGEDGGWYDEWLGSGGLVKHGEGRGRRVGQREREEWYSDV